MIKIVVAPSIYITYIKIIANKTVCNKSSSLIA